MEREVRPELLDELPAVDPRAARARQDLKRVNVLMGHAPLMVQALSSGAIGPEPKRLVELGAGDGSFLLRVARQLGSRWRGTRVRLVDRASIVAPETTQAFQAEGWQVDLAQADVMEWLNSSHGWGSDAMLANLFLHHFSQPQLRQIFGAAASLTRLFIAIEPRRSARSLFFSQLLWLVGCSQVTRHDARVSVRAGFAGRELAAVWPQNGSWDIDERAVGAFSHLFIARCRE